MPAGIIQLVAIGKENLFLTHDPQITFFKIIYRRHTNFSQEDIDQNFTHEVNFGKKSSCKLSICADLINKVCLKIVLPEILKTNNNTKFAWIKNIGHAIIKTLEVEIDGKIIDTHYGEWMYLWSCLTNDNNTEGFNKLIGNVPELTDYTESKPSYELFIPLYFWFCRSTGLSLPIVNLQYSDIRINLELYEIEKCCSILPTHYINCVCNIDNFIPNEYLVQNNRYGIFSHYDIIEKKLYYTPITQEKFIGYEPDISIFTNNIKPANYIIYGTKSNFSVNPVINSKSMLSNNISLKYIKLKECYLLVSYVFIENEERLKLAKSKKDYLIEQLYYTPDITVDNGTARVLLNIDQPCKLTLWVAQLVYLNNFNDRFNFTDSYDEKKGNSLFVNETYKLNSQLRTSNKLHNYYQYVQPLQYTQNYLPKGTGMYSFSLFPTDFLPSGTTNMSQIELIELNMKLNDKINVNNKVKIRSYSLCYNVWRVDSGLSSLIFIR